MRPVHLEIVVAEAILYFDSGTISLILVELYGCQAGDMVKVLPRDHEIFVGDSSNLKEFRKVNLFSSNLF